MSAQDREGGDWGPLPVFLAIAMVFIIFLIT